MPLASINVWRANGFTGRDSHAPAAGPATKTKNREAQITHRGNVTLFSAQDAITLLYLYIANGTILDISDKQMVISRGGLFASKV